MSKIFGERLKDLRISKGISQQQFAKIISTSQASLSKWENDVQEPCIDDLKKIAEYFNVSADYLIGIADWY